MDNKIGPVDRGVVGKGGGKPGATATDTRVTTGHPMRSTEGGPPVKTDDTVALTGRAQLLERLEKSLAPVSPVDGARVAEIRSAIESDEYTVDSTAVAQAMLRFERLLDS